MNKLCVFVCICNSFFRTFHAHRLFRTPAFLLKGARRLKLNTRPRDGIRSKISTTELHKTDTLILRADTIGALDRVAFGAARRTSPDRRRVGVCHARCHRPIVLQTPWLHILSSAKSRLHHHTSFPLHLLLCCLWREAQCPEQRRWIRFMRRLQRTLHRWVRAHYDPDLVWHDALQDGDGGSWIWRLACNDLDRLACYDAQQQRSTPTALSGGNCYARFILHLEYIWINDRTRRAGAQFQMLQAQHSGHEPPLQFAFVDPRPAAPTEQPPPPVPKKNGDSDRLAHPVYGKYFRMLGVGIPRPCVEQKMRMANLEASVLDTPP